MVLVPRESVGGEETGERAVRKGLDEQGNESQVSDEFGIQV